MQRVAIIGGWYELLLKTTRLMALIGLIGLLSLAILTVCEVLSRSFFEHAMPGVADVSSLIVGVAMASCFGIVAVAQGHIKVSIMKVRKRTTSFLNACGNLMGVGLFTVYTWQMWCYAEYLGKYGEVTTVVSWPREPWMKACAVLLAFCVPAHLILTVRDFSEAIFNKKIQ
jgi:TRAP-type C4-dicarboxylate transport system permease small subunit